MRVSLGLAALWLTSCALVDGLTGDKDGGQGPDYVDADRGECPMPNFDGPFDEPTTASEPTTVAIGDFDGDTFQDIAVGASTGIELMFGNGNGGFPRRQFVPNGVSRSFDLVVGRFDAPPDDLLAASDDPAQPSPLIYGQADPANLSATASGLGRAVALGVSDLDGNTHEDMISVVNNAGYYAMWRLNDGAGQFVDGPGTWPFASLPSQVVAEDFVGNGYIDLAFLEGDVVRLIEGDGSGSFASHEPELTFTARPKRMLRFLDSIQPAVYLGVAFECNPCEDSLIFANYDRDGTHLGSMIYSGFGAVSPVEAVAGSIDGDSQPDLVLANGMGTGSSPPEVLLGTCWNGERFARHVALDIGGTPADVAVGDLNNDDLDDIVVAIPTTNRVGLLLSWSGGGRTKVIQVSDPCEPRARAKLE